MASTSISDTPLASHFISDTPLASHSISDTPLASHSISDTPLASPSISDTPLASPSISDTPLASILFKTPHWPVILFQTRHWPVILFQTRHCSVILSQTRHWLREFRGERCGRQPVAAASCGPWRRARGPRPRTRAGRLASRVTGCNFSQETRVWHKVAVDGVAGIFRVRGALQMNHARYVTGCQVTQETRVYTDVAGIFRVAVPWTLRRRRRGSRRAAGPLTRPPFSLY